MFLELSRNPEQIPMSGSQVDAAHFGSLRCWPRDGGVNSLPISICDDGQYLSRIADVNHIGLEWLEPRDLEKLEVTFSDSAPAEIKVQYWRNHWPTVAPSRKPGGARGWIRKDDPWHGEWTTIRGEVVCRESSWSITCDPIDFPELGGRAQIPQLDVAEDYLARFRRTLKVRFVFDEAEPVGVTSIQALTAGRWEPIETIVRFGSSGHEDWSGRVMVHNGVLAGITPIDFDGADAVLDRERWRCRVVDQSKGLRISLLFSSGEDAPGGQTVVTLHTNSRSFSYRPLDLHVGPLDIADYGVAVSMVGASRSELPDSRTIYDRVFDEPEQSLDKAMSEIPPLDPAKHDSYSGLGLYLPLGVDAGRQEFALRHNGEIFLDKRFLKLLGRDAAKLIWPSHRLRFLFGSGVPPAFPEVAEQSLRDGWLPIVRTRWANGAIAYKQITFTTLANGQMSEPEARRGDEDIVCFVRFEISNTSVETKKATLTVMVAPQEQLELNDGKIMALGRIVPDEGRRWKLDAYPFPVLRATLKSSIHGESRLVSCTSEDNQSESALCAIYFATDLSAGETAIVDLVIPFVAEEDEQAWERVAALDFDSSLENCATYWHRMVSAGTAINSPDKILADFHKAVQCHIAISVDKDPISGQYVVPAATWEYGACGNEACWQIRFLDQSGHHERAADYLETFLQTQGMEKPEGLFSSAEGAFQGLDIDAGRAVRSDYSFRYNLDHGVILACLADHYRYTADRAWLEHAAPYLEAAADFIIRERQATMIGDPECTLEWGLLPAGDLEDNQEWYHWFAVNAHAHAGMRAASIALADLNASLADRIAGEAEAYRADIRSAVRKAMVNAPVVRLRDGSAIPHIPTRTGIRGRELGWFREAAYGALHLLEGGVFGPDEEEITWILKDLEDNLFSSLEWGHVIDVENEWFSQGGFTIQPNLMDLGIDYLRRGEIKHALRALLNNIAASLYPDVRAFAEHAVYELGQGVGPFYKSSDEAKAMLWLRDFLLREDGGTLHLAQGVPRAWFQPGEVFGVENAATFFGQVSYQIQAAEGGCTARIELNNERAPEWLLIHLRPVKRIKLVILNGVHLDGFAPGDEIVEISTPPAQIILEAKYDNL